MPKIRIFVFLSTIIVVGLIGLFVSFYARGYRLNFRVLLSNGAIQFEPNGILVIKSEPDGASVFINGELKTATSANLSLAPGTYDIEVKRDGYFSWYKRLVIDKEVVTQATASLFKSVASLSPATFSGAQNPVESADARKIAYIDDQGLWIMDTFTLPLGFSNDPKKITDGDLTNATYQFSPDGRQILLTISNSLFLLDTGTFTQQSERVNISGQKEVILTRWQNEKKVKDQSLTRALPPEVIDVLGRRSTEFVFSPDENMILYTASTSGTLSENLIKPLPGASTQKQERTIKQGNTYIYDIKEDRNFLISDQPINQEESQIAIRWMPSSRHLLLASPNQITVMDYDGTNRQVIYSGIYASPYAFPYTNTTKILVLTNLGSDSSTPNLYTLTVK